MSMLRVESRESAHLKSRVRDMSVVPNVVSFTALLAAITPIAKLQRNADNTYDPILIRDTDSLIANFGDPRVDPEKYIDLYSIMQLVGNGTSCYVAKVNSGEAGVYTLDFASRSVRYNPNDGEDSADTDILTLVKDESKSSPDDNEFVYVLEGANLKEEDRFRVFKLEIAEKDEDDKEVYKELARDNFTTSWDDSDYRLYFTFSKDLDPTPGTPGEDEKPAQAAKLVLPADATENYVTFTAKVAGEEGNSIRVQIVNDEVNTGKFVLKVYDADSSDPVEYDNLSGDLTNLTLSDDSPITFVITGNYTATVMDTPVNLSGGSNESEAVPATPDSVKCKILAEGDRSMQIRAYSSTSDDITIKCYLTQAKPYSLKAFYLNVDLLNADGKSLVYPGAKIKLTNELTNQSIVNNLNSVLGTYVQFELVDSYYAGACAENGDRDHSIAYKILNMYAPFSGKGTKASAKENGLTVTAKEGGPNGNNLSLVITKAEGDSGDYTIKFIDSNEGGKEYEGTILASSISEGDVPAETLGSILVGYDEEGGGGGGDDPDPEPEPEPEPEPQADNVWYTDEFIVIVNSESDPGDNSGDDNNGDDNSNDNTGDNTNPDDNTGDGSNSEQRVSVQLGTLLDLEGTLDLADVTSVTFELTGGDYDRTSPRVNLNTGKHYDADSNTVPLDAAVTTDSSPRFEVTKQDYINAILKFKDRKYVGCLMSDMTAPMHSCNDDGTPINDTSKEGTKDLNFGMPSYEERRSLHYYLKEVACERKDSTVVLSTPYCKDLSNKTPFTVDDACNWVASIGEYADLWDYGETNTDDYSKQSFYLEMYYSWLSQSCTKVVDGNVSSVQVKVAPSNLVVNNILVSYRTRGVHYPVAGDQLGTLPSSCTILQNPATKAKRDQLVQYRINPIWDTGTRGIQIYGNETLNAGYTDLNAAHIARTLVYIRSQVDDYTETLKFLHNKQSVWDMWKTNVSVRILEPLRSTGAISSYRVSMGLDTTSVEEIANRKINGLIELTFYQSVEIFDLTFVVYSSATTVDEANPL